MYTARLLCPIISHVCKIKIYVYTKLPVHMKAALLGISYSYGNITILDHGRLFSFSFTLKLKHIYFLCVSYVLMDSYI